MFRPRRRGYGYGGGGGFGMILLGLQLVNLFNYLSRTNQFLPVTLGVLGVNILAFLQPGHNWPSLRQVCISVQGVWFQKEWKRVFLAPFFHGNDFHLYYNMASFVWKAISLERHFGSGYFLYMMAVFSIATNLVYLAINFALAELLDQWSYIQSCAVGFSGVIFAVKVVTTHMQPRGMTLVMGMFPIPMRLACWAELVLISVLFPNVSFVGHLSGILVGLAFVSGPLRALMELPLSLLNGVAPAAAVGGGQQGRSYTYRAGTTASKTVGDSAVAGTRVEPLPKSDYVPISHRPPAEDPSQTRREANPHLERAYSSYTYASGSTGWRPGPPTARNNGEEEEEVELQEAIRRSMEETHPQPHLHPRQNVDEHDREMQMALERSLSDAQDHNPPVEPNVNPPPYNPNYPPLTTVEERSSTVNSHPVGLYPDISAQSAPSEEGGNAHEPHSSHTVVANSNHEPTSHSQESSSLRRRSPGSSSAVFLARDELQSTEGERRRASDGVLSREGLRAARLHKFERPSQQRLPLDVVSRRGSSQSRK